jgi:hypothetical protein
MVAEVSTPPAAFAALLAFWYLHWWATAKFVSNIWPPRDRAEWAFAVGYPIAAAGFSFAVVWLVSK